MITSVIDITISQVYLIIFNISLFDDNTHSIFLNVNRNCCTS